MPPCRLALTPAARPAPQMAKKGVADRTKFTTHLAGDLQRGRGTKTDVQPERAATTKPKAE